MKSCEDCKFCIVHPSDIFGHVYTCHKLQDTDKYLYEEDAINCPEFKEGEPSAWKYKGEE